MRGIVKIRLIIGLYRQNVKFEHSYSPLNTNLYYHKTKIRIVQPIALLKKNFNFKIRWIKNPSV